MTVRRYDDDPELVRAAQAGDGAAFTTLFQRWFDPCVEVARRIVHDPETAAEVAQETFLVAWRQLSTLRDPSAFGGWVLRTSRNKALNRLERERRSVAVDQDEHPLLADLEAVDDVAAEVAASDQQQLLWAASTALGEREASVLDLHLRHGLDAAEIADELEITTNNAHQVLFRMKGKLAGAIRAWVLFKGGDPACDRLRQELRTAGATSFSASTVKVIDRHVRGCDDCSRRQAAILAPEAMFAAVPALPVAGFLRERAAAALRDSGVPLGPDAATPAADPSGSTPEHGAGQAGTDPGDPTAPGEGSDPDPPGGADGGDQPSPAGTAPAIAARRGLLLAALAGLMVLVVLAVVLLTGRDDDVAVSEEPVGTSTVTEPRSGTSASTTTTLPVVAPPSTDPPTTPAPTTTVAPTPPPPPPSSSTAPPTTAPPTPTIISFVVTPASTPGGACPAGQWASTLAWRTSDATTVAVTSPAGAAPVAGGPFGTAVGCALTPGSPWTLVATGPGGSASATG